MENLTIPSILTAKTYFWQPGQQAWKRRANEEKHLNSVTQYFEARGFEVEVTRNTVVAICEHLKVTFSYTESCSHVYKSLEILRDGKKSNITALKKFSTKTEKRIKAINEILVAA